MRREDWNASELARWAYIAIVIVASISMAVLFSLILSDRDNLRKEATIRATQIQQQRYDATFQNCVDQNRRHDNTIKRLKALVKKDNPSFTKQQVDAAVNQTEFLIDALVPVRNCKAVAEKSVHPLANPKGR
jgi:hypothetical protein